MVKYSDDRLDALFAALADRTRRGILDALSRNGDAAVVCRIIEASAT